MATLLFCVMCEADRRLTRGETTRGLELLALVRSHPAVTTDHREEMARILGRVALDTDVLDTVDVSAAPDIAAVADELIDELAAGD